jgi:hypothetical protein
MVRQEKQGIGNREQGRGNSGEFGVVCLCVLFLVPPFGPGAPDLRCEQDAVTGGVEKAGEIIPFERVAPQRTGKAWQGGLRTVFCTAEEGRARRESPVLIGFL